MVCVRRTHGYVIIHLVQVAVEWLVVSLSIIRHYICKYNTVKYYAQLLVVFSHGNLVVSVFSSL